MTLIDLIERCKRPPRSRRAFRLGTAPPTPSTRRPGWCCGRSACRWTRWTSVAERELTRRRAGARSRRWSTQRIDTRQPAAYLTGEAWLQGVPFYVDERVIVPRSLIAELLRRRHARRLAGRRARSACSTCAPATAAWRCWPRWPGPRSTVDATDLSADALAVARINVERHGLAERITLRQSRPGCAARRGRYDLILCNPPYVNARSHGRAAGRVPRRAGAGAGRRRRRHGLRAPPAARRAGAPERRRRAGAGDRPRARALRAAFPRARGRSGWPPAPATTRCCCSRATRCSAEPPMITLRNLTLRRGTKVVLQGASVDAATRARRSAWSAATAPASRACSRCSPTGCRPTPATSRSRRAGASARWRRTCPRPTTAPPTSCSQGDTPLMQAQAALAAAEAADDGHAMADAHHALDEAGAFDARAARAGAAARPGLPHRAARRAGEQLLRRLAHAAAAGARADVPGRPDAARRADQPPRPRRAGLARSLAASATTAR